MISTPSFKIEANLKINLDDDDKHTEKDKYDNKSNKKEMLRTKPNMNDEISYEEEKTALILALILGITFIFAFIFVGVQMIHFLLVLS